MKTCTKCLEPKPPKEFHFKNKLRKIRHAVCGACTRVLRKDHYIRNRDETLKRTKIRNERIFLEHVEKLKQYLLKHQCVDCGEDDTQVLEFDHVKGKKIWTISMMLRNCWSWETILTEIEKCQVRCANCHRKRTIKQHKHYRMLW